VPDLKQTSSYSALSPEDVAAEVTSPPVVRAGQAALVSSRFVEALGVPAMLLDEAGMVLCANDASAALLQLDRRELVDEPLLTWIGGAQGRAGFGRQFLALTRGGEHEAFTRELDVRPRLGPPVRCQCRVARVTGFGVLLTLEAFTTDEDADADYGRAVTRALDALDEGVMLIDATGKVVHSNRFARDLLGGRVEGRSLNELVSTQEAGDAVAKGLSLAQAGSWRGEVSMRRLDGDSLPVALSLASGAGDGATAMALIRDLTAQRQRAFEARLSTHVDRALVSSEDPRTGVSMACQALVVGIDAAAACVVTRVGYTPERWYIVSDEAQEVRTVEETDFEWLQSLVTEGELTEVEDPRLANFGLTVGSAKTDASDKVRPAVGAVALRAPTGVVGYLLVQLSARSTPRRTRGFALVERVAPQLALGLAGGLSLMETRALLAYQLRVLDQTSVLLNSLDGAGRVVTWNRASEQLLGTSSDEARGQRFGVDFAVANDPEAWRDFLERVRVEDVGTMEMGFMDAAGGEVPLHIEGRALKEGARVTGMVLVGLDLRNRRALESQVLRSQKLASVGLLAAGIAHEINNPLSGVVGYSRLLLNRSLPEEVRERVEKISASAERCRKIVEGVLLFSRQGGGEPRPTDLRDIVHRVTQIGEYQWRMHNVQVLIDAPSPVAIQADPDQLEQVLLNLMSNAVDAMPRGGAIQIVLGHTDDGRASLQVTDSGQGIPSDVIPRIFDPFFSTKEIGKGTGLGLAISYGIIQDHGGDILVKSNPGDGTTFSVLLPALAEADEAASTEGTSNS
jgi:PAS domain S-box-containing protein